MRAEGGSQVIQYTGGQPISTYSTQGTVYPNIEYTGGNQYIYNTRYSLYKYIVHWRSSVHIQHKVQFIQIYNTMEVTSTYTTQGTVYTNI